MPTPLRILIIEDSPPHALLLALQLESAGYEPVWERVETAEAMRAALAREPWDLVLSDYCLPEFSAPRALQILKESGLDLPFIIVTGSVGEEVVVEAMKAGAHDYLIKGSLARLVPAIQRELREAQVRRARTHAEEALQFIMAHAPCLFWHAEVREYEERPAHPYRWETRFPNETAAQCFFPLEVPPGESYADAWHRSKLPEDLPRTQVNATAAFRSGSSQCSQEFRCRRRDGEVRWLHEDVYIEPAAEGRWRLTGVCTDITGRKQAEEALVRSHEQLRALTARLQRAREEERTWMARQIHDELGQALTCLKMDTASIAAGLPAGQGPLHAKLASMSALLDRTIQTVRRIATELRPGILDTLGLQAAIEWLAQDFAARTGIRCHVSAALPGGEPDPERSTALFRILQEILTNVAQHAGASRVKIILREAAGSVLLQVRDNGRGIAEKEICSSDSLGLLGMRERASLVGGEICVRGSPGTGTTVLVRIPFSSSDDSALHRG